MLKVLIAEVGHSPLPALPVTIGLGETIGIGAGTAAAVRLPLGAVAAEHFRVTRTANGWFFAALGDATITSTARVLAISAGDQGSLPLPCTLTIDRWQVELAQIDEGSMVPVSPMRTASLARELARSLLSGSSAPALTIEAGPGAGTRRELPPPEVRITLGRGDDADWQLADGDLSRLHVAIERSWDGVRLFDLHSKNGTLVDGVAVTTAGVALASGARVRIAGITLRFDDPAAALVDGAVPVELSPAMIVSAGDAVVHVGGALPAGVTPASAATVGETVARAPAVTVTRAVGPLAPTADEPRWLFGVALALCGGALIAIAWLLVAALTATVVAPP